MDKINVYVISPRLPIPPVEGGAIETLIYETVNFYKHSNVFIFSEWYKSYNTYRYDSEYIHYYQLKTPILILNLQDLLRRMAVKGIFFLYDFFFIRRVTKIINIRPDIIHIHNNFYYIPYLKKHFPLSRIVLHMNNNFLFYYDYLYLKYKQILDLTDKIIVCSKYIGNQIINNYKDCQNKITIIHNGVSLNRFKKLPDNDTALVKWRKRLELDIDMKVIIFVGRICKDKGVDVLIYAFKKLCKEYSNLKLLIVGSSSFAEGKSTPYLRNIYNIANVIRDKIVFTGFIAHDELNYLYNLSSICVVPSVFNEPFGLVNLEAMAAGCVVVASNVGGVPEIIKNNETGLLVSPNDVNALYEKIKYLIDNEDIRQNLISKATEHIKNSYDWSIVADRYEGVYKDILTKSYII